MIKTVIFDMGKVLLDYQSEIIIKTQTNDPALIEKIKLGLFSSYQWALLDAGLISLEDALTQILTRFSEDEKAIVTHCFYHWIDTNLFVKTDMADLVKDLHDQGYRLFVLSNANCLMHKIEKEIFPHYDYFEKIYFSCDYQLMKPQLGLYQLVLNEQHLDPNECLFVDDLLDNVKAAQVCGIHGCHFDGSAQCVYAKLEQLNGKENQLC